MGNVQKGTGNDKQGEDAGKRFAHFEILVRQ